MNFPEQILRWNPFQLSWNLILGFGAKSYKNKFCKKFLLTKKIALKGVVFVGRNFSVQYHIKNICNCSLWHV